VLEQPTVVTTAAPSMNAALVGSARTVVVAAVRPSANPNATALEAFLWVSSFAAVENHSDRSNASVDSRLDTHKSTSAAMPGAKITSRIAAQALCKCKYITNDGWAKATLAPPAISA
jgi:hypothetical protein